MVDSRKITNLYGFINISFIFSSRLLLLQWKQDIEGAVKLIREAVRLDDKCDFAYETLATLEVQRYSTSPLLTLYLFVYYCY